MMMMMMMIMMMMRMMMIIIMRMMMMMMMKMQFPDDDDAATTTSAAAAAAAAADYKIIVCPPGDKFLFVIVIFTVRVMKASKHTQNIHTPANPPSITPTPKFSTGPAGAQGQTGRAHVDRATLGSLLC